MLKDILNQKKVKELSKAKQQEITGGYLNGHAQAATNQKEKFKGDPSRKYECYFTHIGPSLYFSHYSAIDESNGDNIRCYRSSFYVD
ncbi:hypothetical protein [uncultured Tenacibaculum sp.]|uniref:hypothetical protein n=1 Tax=uncultured Tenacibaculum sp. TaxID=174713 RepID=UPI002628ED64|nr:hypothetical protein [uncultured Tenacibaculum sp.]